MPCYMSQGEKDYYKNERDRTLESIIEEKNKTIAIQENLIYKLNEQIEELNKRISALKLT